MTEAQCRSAGRVELVGLRFTAHLAPVSFGFTRGFPSSRPGSDDEVERSVRSVGTYSRPRRRTSSASAASACGRHVPTREPCRRHAAGADQDKPPALPGCPEALTAAVLVPGLYRSGQLSDATLPRPRRRIGRRMLGGRAGEALRTMSAVADTARPPRSTCSDGRRTRAPSCSAGAAARRRLSQPLVLEVEHDVREMPHGCIAGRPCGEEPLGVTQPFRLLIEFGAVHVLGREGHDEWVRSSPPRVARTVHEVSEVSMSRGRTLAWRRTDGVRRPRRGARTPSRAWARSR